MYRIELVCHNCFNGQFNKSSDNNYICADCGTVYDDTDDLIAMDYKEKE